MQVSAVSPNREWLTTAEAADYLRLKERKLYELVAEGGIPCTKVTGKWLFPRGDLDRWLAAGMAPMPGLPPAPPPIVGGSTDPLLEWAMRDSGSGLASLAVGSEAGLSRLLAGEVVAAAIHLHALDVTVDANVAAMHARPGFADAVLVGFVAREQGLLVAPGNPRGFTGIADAARARARMAMRQPGAGAQLLLMALLHRAGLAGDALGSGGPVCATGPDLAQAVRSGRADCGIASRAVAQAAGLGFVPLAWERFDLVTRQRDYFRPPLQALAAFMATAAFRDRAAEIGGYDLAWTGKVRWVA